MTSCGHCTGDDDTCYVCMKHQVKYCQDCARCKDPTIYCKFRPACIIHFWEKEQARALKNSSLGA